MIYWFIHLESQSSFSHRHLGGFTESKGLPSFPSFFLLVSSLLPTSSGRRAENEMQKSEVFVGN